MDAGFLSEEISFAHRNLYHRRKSAGCPCVFSVRYEKDKIATIIFSCMHSWRIPWAHAGKMLIIMKDGTRSGPFQFDSGSLTGEFCPILDSGEDIERTIAYLREELKRHGISSVYRK